MPIIKSRILFIFILILLFPVFLFSYFTEVLCEEKPKTYNLKVTERDAIGRVIEDWNSTHSNLFTEALWNKQNIYDTGHYLMVPLHAAFYCNDKKMIVNFSNQFRLFMDFLDGRGVAATGAGTQNNAQYIYLASRFVYLCYENGYEHIIPEGLLSLIRGFALEYFFKPGKWWKDQKQEMNMDERFSFIMSDVATEYEYYKVIPDLNLFITAIAADVLAINEMQGIQTHNHDEPLKYIVNRLYELLKHEVVFLGEGDRWLLQPGRWTDHKDYLYAGHNELHVEMEPAPIDDIAQDSSHFHRFPLFIESWKNAFPKNSREFTFFERLRTGLTEQMISSVIIPPTEEHPYYRLTNFMDGRNGVYRYKYSTNAEQKGTLPFQLSGTFLLGWWSFLKDERIAQIYKEIFYSFPLSEQAILCYTGANTTRKRHPLFKTPDCFMSNGITFFIAYFASLL